MANQYYICVSTYHGADLHILENGDSIRITTAPIYTDEDQRNIVNDWGCAQYGPFDCIETARREMTQLYGPCRPFDWDDPEYNAITVEAYRAGEYEVWSREEFEEISEFCPAPDDSDEEVEMEVLNCLDALNIEGVTADRDDIRRVFLERREAARAREGYFDL